MDAETSVSLRCHIYADFANANSWAELVARLEAKQFHLLFDGGRLVLVNAVNGVDLCTCRHLGFGFAALAARFGKPCVLADTGRVVARPGSSATALRRQARPFRYVRAA